MLVGDSLIPSKVKLISCLKISQQQIVIQIKKEHALVNANKKLIVLFEKKIKDSIAKVWGDLILSEKKLEETDNVDVVRVKYKGKALEKLRRKLQDISELIHISRLKSFLILLAEQPERLARIGI